MVAGCVIADRSCRRITGSIPATQIPCHRNSATCQLWKNCRGI